VTKSVRTQGKTNNDWHCRERHLGNPLIAGQPRLHVMRDVD
jgi:hypothetical protein